MDEWIIRQIGARYYAVSRSGIFFSSSDPFTVEDNHAIRSSDGTRISLPSTPGVYELSFDLASLTP